MKPVTSYIPNTVTCLNLVSGCIAVAMAFHLNDNLGGLTGREWCYIFIGAAAVFDFCDGLCARLLKAYSDMGKELDSLCDLVSFGVAPAALIYNTMISLNTEWGWAVATILIPVMGALRLAKFNIDNSQTTSFVGLPIPANAIFFVGLSGWIESYNYPGPIVMGIIIVLISLSMVSTIRMFSLKFKNLSLVCNVKRYVLILAAIAFVAVYGISGLAWTILLYMLISLFSRRHWSDETY